MQSGGGEIDNIMDRFEIQGIGKFRGYELAPLKANKHYLPTELLTGHIKNMSFSKI